MPHLIMPLASLGLVVVTVACAPAADTPQSRQRQMFGLVEKFDRFDENGDGYLDRRELDSGRRQIGADFTPAEMDRIMTGYDRNRDGRISLHEAQQRAAAGPANLQRR